MTKQDLENFIKLNAQLEGLQTEIGALSKKSPNDALNIFKLGIVNQKLLMANKLLGTKYKPFNDFDKFDENFLPSNSDTTMVLSQYIICLEKFRSDNIKTDNAIFGNWFWVLDGKLSEFRTIPPK